MSDKFVSSLLETDKAAVQEGARVEIACHGVEQYGPSFEARVFLNNAEATVETPLTAQNGYVGSFHVYGYGFWPEDSSTNAGNATAPIRAPMERRLEATDAVRAALAKDGTLRVTIVPVFPGTQIQPTGGVLRLKDVSIEITPNK